MAFLRKIFEFWGHSNNKVEVIDSKMTLAAKKWRNYLREEKSFIGSATIPRFSNKIKCHLEVICSNV